MSAAIIPTPTDASGESAPQVYQGYEAWKGWGADAFMQPDAEARRYYLAELQGQNLRGERVLELGFGNGAFLAFAQAEGAQVFGTEVSDQGVALAQARGVTVLPIDLTHSLAAHAGRFALIAAFDVLEHLSYAQTEALLPQICRLLKPGGRFIARFPNGQSPFGRIYQHADATHVATLSASILVQMAAGTPLHLVRAGDPARPREGNVMRRAAQMLRDVARRGVELGVRSLYRVAVPLDPNVVVVFERGAAS